MFLTSLCLKIVNSVSCLPKTCSQTLKCKISSSLIKVEDYLALRLLDSDCAFDSIFLCFHLWKNFNKDIYQEHMPCGKHLGTITAIKNSIIVGGGRGDSLLESNGNVINYTFLLQQLKKDKISF